MTATALLMQTDRAIVDQLERLATAQVVVAVSVALIALSAFAVALAALFAVRKVLKTVDRTVEQLTPKVDPLLASATRIAGDAEQLAGNVKRRVEAVLETVEDLNARLKLGATAVESRVKQFGTVVDVVQTEAEEILQDAASTAHGVHAAAEVLRSEKRPRLPEGGDEEDDDLFTD